MQVWKSVASKSGNRQDLIKLSGWSRYNCRSL